MLSLGGPGATEADLASPSGERFLFCLFEMHELDKRIVKLK